MTEESEKKYTVAEDGDYLFFAIKATDYELQTLTHTEKYMTLSFTKKKDKCCKDGGNCQCKTSSFGNNTPTFLAG